MGTLTTSLYNQSFMIRIMFDKDGTKLISKGGVYYDSWLSDICFEGWRGWSSLIQTLWLGIKVRIMMTNIRSMIITKMMMTGYGRN